MMKKENHIKKPTHPIYIVEHVHIKEHRKFFTLKNIMKMFMVRHEKKNQVNESYPGVTSPWEGDLLSVGWVTGRK
jgi:hypothetical protein